jgi:hypothetical protein
MERSLSNTNTQLSYDRNGKVNPKSKKLPLPQSNKKFIEDDSKKILSIQSTPNHLRKDVQNIKKNSHISREKTTFIKDHT